MFIVSWLISRTFRQAVDFRRQVRRYAKAQEDLLEDKNLTALHEACDSMDKVLDSGADRKAINEELSRLEKVANENIRPYPNSGTRENIDVILVAVAVAFGVRTFFLQPFKIPTGSMQPTLYGITHEDLKESGEEIPGGVGRFVDRCFRGIKYVHLKAEESGTIEGATEPKTVFPLVKKQTLTVGSKTYTFWNPPENLLSRAGLYPGQHFKAGDDIIKLKVVSGDHLFVNRFTYNWRPPRRGEIIVFKTEGIEGLQQDQFYIKRLVGMPDEQISIGNDQHVRINGDRLTAATGRFENVYTFDPDTYELNTYYGHVNGVIGSQFQRGNLSPLLYNEADTFHIKKDHYFVLGDNTLNSKDSRDWGDFPKKNVIGQSAFVYWPISERFGWSHR